MNQMTVPHAARTVSVSMPGPRIERGGAMYSYGILFDAIPAQSAREGSIQIEDSAFEIMYGTHYAYLGQAAAIAQQTISTRVIAPATVEMKTQDGFRMQNIALPVPLMFGDGTAPMVWPVTRKLRAKAIVTFNVANLHASESLTLWLALIGAVQYA